MNVNCRAVSDDNAAEVATRASIPAEAEVEDRDPADAEEEGSNAPDPGALAAAAAAAAAAKVSLCGTCFLQEGEPSAPAFRARGALKRFFRCQAPSLQPCWYLCSRSPPARPLQGTPC